MIMVCNALGTNECLELPFAGYPDGFSFLMDRLARAAAELGCTALRVIGPAGSRAFLEARLPATMADASFVPVDAVTAFGVMEAVKSSCPSDADLVWFRADALLTSFSLAARLLADHRDFHAELTFAEGYPQGFAPVVVRGDISGVLADLARDSALEGAHKAFLWELVRPVINNFEVETRLARHDHRMARLDFHASTRRDLQLCASWAARADGDCDAFEEALLAGEATFRTLPAFMNVQLSEECPTACAWCPHAKRRGDEVLRPGRYMAPEDFLSLCRRFQDFSPRSTVSLGLWGEPSRHPGIYDILAGLKDFPFLDFLVETSGIGWDLDCLSRLAPELPPGLVWIVSLDTLDPDLYREIRGEGFPQARDTLRGLHALFPGQVHVQAVRTTRNEETLPAFVAWGKEKGLPVIIQKYDHFCQTLVDLRVSDISPVDRIPCWHLKRDLHVLVDGTVTRCREIADSRDGLGSALTGDLSAIWAAMEPLYLAHLDRAYPDPCGACDESYTFNF